MVASNEKSIKSIVIFIHMTASMLSRAHTNIGVRHACYAYYTTSLTHPLNIWHHQFFLTLKMTFSMAIAISIEPFMEYKRVVSNGFISVYTPSPSMHFLVVATHAIKVIIIIKDCDFNQCQWWKRIKIRIEGEREREIKGEGEMRWDEIKANRCCKGMDKF